MYYIMSNEYENTSFYLIFCKDELITDKYVGHTINFTQRKNFFVIYALELT